MNSEDIEFLLMQEYPGLHEIDYQGLAEEFGHDLAKARAEAARAVLVMKAAKIRKEMLSIPEPVMEEEIWNA